MDHDKTGCQTPPERPRLCINNCGFFGSAATMNLCSKCHKDMVLKQEQQAKLASAVNATSANNTAEVPMDMQAKPAETKSVFVQPSSAASSTGETVEAKLKEGPNRCNTCNKRIGLTGFKCRCGNLFCGSHRYSDKHNCPFDYRTAARDAIAKANPVVKAEKLGKI